MRKDPDYLRGISDGLLGVAVELATRDGDNKELLKEVLVKAQECIVTANTILNEADDDSDKFSEALRRIGMDVLPQIGPVMSKLFEDILEIKTRTQDVGDQPDNGAAPDEGVH